MERDREAGTTPEPVSELVAAPAVDRGSALDPSTVLSLQRTAGNASVTRALLERRTLQRYGTPIPTVASPSVHTMREYIDLIKRVEAASPGRSALQLATLIMRSKYNSQGFDWLLPSSAGAPGVTAGGGITAADVTTLSGEFDVTLPQGGTEDVSHVMVAIVAMAEGKAPGAGGAGGKSAMLVGAPPSGLSQVDIATWAGDPGSAAGEWMTAHPHPKGGTTMQAYLDEFSPESDMLGDIDGLAMTSKSAAAGFAFDGTKPLSDNLERFYFPAGGREGKNRRFHTFCSVMAFGLEADGVTLSSSARTAMDTRIKAFADWYMANDPNILTWMALNSSSNDLFNPVPRHWVRRADDWRWFAAKFKDFVQRNLQAEGL